MYTKDLYYEIFSLYLHKNGKKAMNSLSIRDFRAKMAQAFERTDAGERVFIRRKNRLYTIVPVEEGDLDISPQLAAKIEQARKEHQEKKTVNFNNAQEAQKWMDEL